MIFLLRGHPPSADSVPQIGLDDHVEKPKIGREISGDNVDFDDDDMEPKDY
jgi:hypothetical protein